MTVLGTARIVNDGNGRTRVVIQRLDANQGGNSKGSKNDMYGAEEDPFPSQLVLDDGPKRETKCCASTCQWYHGLPSKTKRILICMMAILAVIAAFAIFLGIARLVEQNSCPDGFQTYSMGLGLFNNKISSAYDVYDDNGHNLAGISGSLPFKWELNSTTASSENMTFKRVSLVQIFDFAKPNGKVFGKAEYTNSKRFRVEWSLNDRKYRLITTNNFVVYIPRTISYVFENSQGSEILASVYHHIFTFPRTYTICTKKNSNIPDSTWKFIAAATVILDELIS